MSKKISVVARYLGREAAVTGGKWRYTARPNWVVASGAYATVGVYALIHYTPKYSKAMFQDAKQDFLKQAMRVCKEKMPGFEHQGKFSEGFPSVYDGYETQAFWFSQ